MKTRRFSLSNTLNTSPLGQLSLRAKLTLGNMLITFIAIIGMGFYIYYRVQESGSLLTTQLETSVRAKVENDLSSLNKEQSTLLDDFFASMSKNISTIGAMEKNMLSQESSANSGTTWDASTALFQLESGSWDNANTETASIFIPASAEFKSGLASKLNAIKQAELIIPAILNNNPDIIAIYFGGPKKEVVYYPNIDLANIVPADFDVTGRPWYVNASPAQNKDRVAVWSTPYQDAALNGLVITTSIPVYGSLDQFEGVTAMDIQLNKITNLVSNIHVGETGYAFLVDKENRLIALPESGYRDFGVTAETVPLGVIMDETNLPQVAPEFFDVLKKLSSGENDVTSVTLDGVERFMSYHQIPEVQYTLAIIVPEEEMLVQARDVTAQIARETTSTIQVSVLLIVAILSLAALATLGVGTRLMAPLKSLTNVANEIIGGNIDAKADVESRDEIGVLAETLNIMTSTLRDSIRSLEQRVAERTREIERRSNLFKAVAGVGKAITSFRDLSELLQQTTYLIHENFGYYHVGIFLLDEHKEYAVLSAANSEGGHRMLERKHRLKVGEMGIVGYVTQNVKARIALDVGKDAVYFDNPDLPETHSEMALPLVIGGQILGALDVQSKETQAFSEEDISTLQILAEQIAIAIQNANLFDEAEKAIETARVSYAETSRGAWRKILHNQPRIGFLATPPSTVQIHTEHLDSNTAKAVEMGDVISGSDGLTISIPVRVRGQVIGAIRLKKSEISESWTQDETNLAIALSDQLGGALESARLYKESQQLAARESRISDISARISAVSQTDAILRETVQELGQTLGNASVTFQLIDEFTEQGKGEHPANGKSRKGWD
jgi:GAF domain-containing protein/HAMP domain-containing protein